MAEALTLTGYDLTIADLVRSTDGGAITLAADGLAQMVQSRALIEQAIAEKRPVYGVTTGLGAKATEVLDYATLAEFSVQTLRGRAHAVGDPIATDVVRAGMIVRLNTLLQGYSGARPDVAEHLRDVLNAGLTPVVGHIGSIGASDLVINASIGLALIGEGQMQHGDDVGPSAEMMRACGIEPLRLAPRDGLALANHSSAVAAEAALGVAAINKAFQAAQTAAALSMEGFRANLSAFDARVLAVKDLPGQRAAVSDLMRRFQGSALLQPGAARRLQDPLSFRNVPQIHGATQLALDQAHAVIEIELNGASDNPVTLVEDGEVLSSGVYFTSELALVCETLVRSVVPMAMAQVARMAKLLDPDFSGLRLFLARAHTGSNGFAPVMKVAESALAELTQAAQPTQTWPSVNANGVEDCLTTAPVAARSLGRVAQMSRILSAIEMIVAAQAIDLRGCAGEMGEGLCAIHQKVRDISAPLEQDRPLARDIDDLANLINKGALF